MFYTLLRTHRHKKHANRSYGEKDTSTKRFAHRRKYKTISFMCFNYIITYIRYFIDAIYGIKSNLDSNYKTKVKQIIFYL